MSGTFDRVRAMVAAGNVRVSEHGFQELEEDGIFPDEVIGTVGSGVIVKDYPGAWKGPTVLVRQTLVSGRHIHVVWGFSKANDRLAVLTAYFPDSSLWSPDFLLKEGVTKRVTKLIREGNYVAEVRVDLIPDDGAWGPYLSHEDAMKLSRVRHALRAGNIETAKRDAEVFELLPVA